MCEWEVLRIEGGNIAWGRKLPNRDKHRSSKGSAKVEDPPNSNLSEVLCTFV